ncbi:MAG: phosphoribosylanthranilate isomerase [Verrucomicrobia bacterium]|nr:MAG: phosphoribosylanthranilate isomerase [Verrucomicrobiota bacterium]PYK67569.1 MAG: phosphoribosylanthranilate isomerase [Verrucomicrobiota bacterium]
MVRIKICGITSVAEASLAERYGADAIGLLVGRRHRACDFVKRDVARKICQSVVPFITPVLVTHLEDPNQILRLVDAVPCPVLQLHSDLLPSVLATLRERLRPKKVIGKVSIQGRDALDRAREIESSVDAIVLDSVDPMTDRVGGTGKTHDWSLSAKIVANCKVPVVLAGGLTPQNVMEAIHIVRPFAVDVNSGVEKPDGRKSKERIFRFIAAVRSAS